MKHGLTAYKNYGCRCTVCTTANKNYQKEYREKYGRLYTDSSLKQRRDLGYGKDQ